MGGGAMTDPLALFDAWFAEAQVSEPNDPNAMALATADGVGNPSVRMVLLKGRSPDGFVFYTNLDSRKGEQLKENQQVALLFHWKSLRRQVRIEGHVEPVTDQEADAYFASRGRWHQGRCSSSVLPRWLRASKAGRCRGRRVGEDFA